MRHTAAGCICCASQLAPAPAAIYLPCRQMLTFSSSLSPHTPRLLLFGGVFVVVVHLVLEKVVIVVDVVEQVMMEQGQGRLAGIVLSSSWLPSPSPCLLHNPCARPPLSILCTCTLPTMMLCPPCPGGTIWVKATRCFSHQSFAKTFTNAMHHIAPILIPMLALQQHQWHDCHLL